MFFLDELYKNNQAYPIGESMIEKFIFYRRSNDDIDIDVCQQNINIYKSKNPCISDKAKVVEQQTYNKSKQKYEIVDGENVFRGETLINCMQVLLQIVNYDEEETQIGSKDYDEILNGLSNSSILSGNEQLNKLINSFIEECYSEGNFIAIPYINGYSLNMAKGRLKQRAYGNCLLDSVDTYLKVCFNYFQYGKGGCQLIKYIDTYYKVWKNRYRNNWKLFVEDNILQDFVDDNDTPIEIWKMNSGDIVKDLEMYLDKAVQCLSMRRKRILGIQK